MGYGLFFALSPLQAQTAIKKFSLELKNESLPEALKQLEKAGGKNILFTYNGTESYRVTVSIREKTEREAIDLVLAGKPFLCIEREEYFVVQRKKSDKAIATEGKVYDEKGMPLPFVNILALAADSSFLAGSVTEEDGSFHLDPHRRQHRKQRRASVKYEVKKSQIPNSLAAIQQPLLFAQPVYLIIHTLPF